MTQARRKKNRLLVTATAAATALVLAACSSGGGATEITGAPGADPEEEVTLKMIGYWDTTLITPVIEAFEEDHPTIKINYESVSFDNLNGVISSRMQSKSADVDVYSADQPLVASWHSMGYTEDLTAAFKDDLDDFAPPVLESNMIGDELHAMPLSTSTWMLYYNKTLLDAAGVEYPSADPAERKTWEEITEDARTVQAAGAKYGMFFDYADKVVMMLQLTNSAGGGGGLTGEGNLTADVTNDGWIKAMDWYSSIFEDGIGPRGIPFEQGGELFGTGQVAYYPSGPWQAVVNSDHDMTDYGVAPMPMFEGGEAVSGNGAWSMAMSPFSENKEASLIFLKWLGIDNGGNYIQTYPRLNVPATNALLETFTEKEIFQAPNLKDDIPKIIPHELNETSVTRPKTVGFVEFENIVERGWADIRNGIDTKSTLERVSTELNESFEKYKTN